MIPSNLWDENNEFGTEVFQVINDSAYLTPLGVKGLLSTLKDPHAHAAAAMMLWTGIRVSKLVRLTMQDICLTQGVLYKCSEISHSKLQIALMPKLLKELEDYTSVYRSLATPNDPFFADAQNHPLTIGRVNAQLRDATTRLGWEHRITSKNLRMSFVMRLCRSTLFQPVKLTGRRTIVGTLSYLSAQSATKEDIEQSLHAFTRRHVYEG